jgi:hypothetical protein
MISETDKAKIDSVKTNLLIAWVFTILVNVGILIVFLVIFLLPFIGAFSVPSYYGASIIAGGLLVLIIPLIIILIFWIPSYMVMRRAGRLHKAANNYDVPKLKANNSVGWAIIALIFTGVIPGILLLISNSAISELSGKTVNTSGMGSDSIDNLKRLKDLLDSGAITQEEYDEQKKKIMKDM